MGQTSKSKTQNYKPSRRKYKGKSFITLDLAGISRIWHQRTGSQKRQISKLKNFCPSKDVINRVLILKKIMQVPFTRRWEYYF